MTTWLVIDVGSLDEDEETKVLCITQNYEEAYAQFLLFHDRLVQSGVKASFPEKNQEYFDYIRGGRHRVEIYSYR